MHDAFFGPGYVATPPRLGQLDLHARGRKGGLAEAFGLAFVPRRLATDVIVPDAAAGPAP